MQITVNGNKQDAPDKLTLAELLASLKVDSETVVVERKGEIFSATEFKNIQVQPGDVLEIVRFMGGG